VTPHYCPVEKSSMMISGSCDKQDRCTHGVWAADHCYKCALAQPEQEPVARLAWVQDFGSMLHLLDAGRKLQDGNHYLYTSPPQREWVGLTTDEVFELAAYYYEDKVVILEEVIEMAEAKLKEKNKC